MVEMTYVSYPVFRGRPGLAAWSIEDRESGIHEAEVLLKEWSDRVTVRGAYTVTGFRPDADLMFWWIASNHEALQDLLLAFRRTPLGRELDLTWVFPGVVRPPEFTPDHVPAFVKGDPPGRYACVYPYVRTYDWYLLPPERRAALLRGHGEMGREFPDVHANTTSSFGLSDWEWILTFESDEPHRIVDCIRRLRDAEARRYTKDETPFVTGLRKPVAEALADLF